MTINCLACGHRIDFGDPYDDYEGQVKCWVCEAILDIKVEEGSLKSMRIVSRSSTEAHAAETL